MHNALDLGSILFHRGFLHHTYSTRAWKGLKTESCFDEHHEVVGSGALLVFKVYKHSHLSDNSGTVLRFSKTASCSKRNSAWFSVVLALRGGRNVMYTDVSVKFKVEKFCTGTELEWTLKPEEGTCQTFLLPWVFLCSSDVYVVSDPGEEFKLVEASVTSFVILHRPDFWET